MIYDEGKDLEPPIVLAEFAQFYLTVKDFVTYSANTP